MRTLALALALTLTTLAACTEPEVTTDDAAATCSDDPKAGLPPCTDGGPPVLPLECQEKLANRSPAVLQLCATAIDAHGVLDYAIYGAWIEANVPEGTCVPVACELPDARCFFEDACNPEGN